MYFLPVLWVFVFGVALADPNQNGVSTSDQRKILDIHNADRNTVAQGNFAVKGGDLLTGPANNMMIFTWDKTLAKYAQQHASRHVFEHTNDAIPGYDPYGQNLGVVYANSPTCSDPDWNGTIAEWFNENIYFSAQYQSSYKFPPDGTPDDQSWGHFSQVVWGNTNKIGCGHSRYMNTETQSCDHLFTCNYYPAGNWDNEAMYTVGPVACAQKNSKYPNLCTSNPPPTPAPNR